MPGYLARTESGDMVCTQCGATVAASEATSVVCPACGPEESWQQPATQPWRPIPIGDLVERGLTAIGITKERVEKLTRTEGKPGGCGCESRKRWMNEVGNKVQIYARNALIAAKKFYVGE